MNLRVAVIALLAAVSLLAFASGQENAGDEDSFLRSFFDELFQSWEVVDSGLVSLQPLGCESVEFKAPQKKVTRLTVDPVDFPEDCLPEKTIQTSSAFLQEDMCRNWNAFFTLPFEASGNSTALVMTDAEQCLSGSNYFFSLKSECSKAVKLSYKVQVRKMSENEVDHCDELEDAIGAVLGVGVTMLFLFFVLPIVLLVVGITLCCCYCPGCPGHKRKQPTVVLAPVNQHEPTQYPAGYEEHIPLTAGPTSAIVQMH